MVLPSPCGGRRGSNGDYISSHVAIEGKLPPPSQTSPPSDRRSPSIAGKGGEIPIFLMATKADVQQRVEISVQGNCDFGRGNGFTDVLLTSVLDCKCAHDAFERLTGCLAWGSSMYARVALWFT
ncbi:hypothetical protein LSM04_006147 [Trypanosoma melophagium]|uniref:uncharacterized protein n=1 Tax=Trypanosoma melophagium TaxID=715481 RepID=UPI00351A7445|nr:hypothetical protein LSM04_006147 [Trypanosoma melophagium]